MVSLGRFSKQYFLLMAARRLIVLMQERYTSSGGAVSVFDRKAKRIQKNRSSLLPDPGVYDYLKDAVATQVVDRVCDVARLERLINGRGLYGVVVYGWGHIC